MANIESTPSLILPRSEEYDRTIAEIAQEVRDDFGAAAYLADIRYRRRHSFDFSSFLLSGAKHVLDLEEKNAEGDLVDPQHQSSNAMLSGLIFANLVSEAVFPVYSSYDAVRYINVHNAMSERQADHFIELGGMGTSAGVQAGLGAASEAGLARLSDESNLAIQEWSIGTIKTPEFRPKFTYGFGLGIYAVYNYFYERFS